jgi:hypothetical protein
MGLLNGTKQLVWEMARVRKVLREAERSIIRPPLQAEFDHADR